MTQVGLNAAKWLTRKAWTNFTFCFVFLLPLSTSKQISIVVLIVFQGRYSITIPIQRIRQLQWRNNTKATSGNFIISFSVKQQAAVKTDQKNYSLFVYDFIYDFFLSKDFQSSYIFNNSTLFGAKQNKWKVIINFVNTLEINLIINFVCFWWLFIQFSCNCLQCKLSFIWSL